MIERSRAGQPVTEAIWLDLLRKEIGEDGLAIHRSMMAVYPLDVGNTYEPSRRGIPHLADAANARRILETLQKDSAKFGTKISIEGPAGVIRIP
jgi:hypothetical protein